jgi:hypothetical protein
MLIVMKTSNLYLRCYRKQRAEKTFRPKTQELTEGCKKMYSEEVHTVYCSANIIGVIRSRRMKCVGCVASAVRSEVHTKLYLESQKTGHRCEIRSTVPNTGKSRTCIVFFE